MVSFVRLFFICLFKCFFKALLQREGKLHCQVAYICLIFPSVHIKMCLQSDCIGRCVITLITFVLLFLHCALSYVSLYCLPVGMHSHTVHMCLAFLQRVFSNVHASYLDRSMHFHTGCNISNFSLLFVSSVSSNVLPERIKIHTGYICLTFIHIQ